MEDYGSRHQNETDSPNDVVIASSGSACPGDSSQPAAIPELTELDSNIKEAIRYPCEYNGCTRTYSTLAVELNTTSALAKYATEADVWCQDCSRSDRITPLVDGKKSSSDLGLRVKSYRVDRPKLSKAP
uniref:Uncharacterized protein n=1 Tax=Timema poppense TaxID=170557 RepID=A0A7R9GUA4_TIMPO|nr:unnamed protein product [Timema poppensis]